jgi:hypothetical protein
MRALMLANPFGVVMVGAFALYELIKKIPAIMEAIYEKFAFVRSIGNFLTGGVDETQQVQRPKSIAQGENVFEENVAKGQMSYKSSADVNVMFGNTPKGTSIQTTQKGADFMKLGIQQQTFSPAL